MSENDMNECDYSLEKVLELGFKTRAKVNITLLAGTVKETTKDGELVAFRTPGTYLPHPSLKRGTAVDGMYISGHVVAPPSEDPVYADGFDKEIYRRYIILEIGNPAVDYFRVEYGSIENIEGLYTAEEAQGNYNLYALGTDEAPKEDGE